MSNRYGSDKEVAAVTYNLKQQRMLEKTMHTLSLEASYSMQLIDLNHRVIKVNYRRLKDKVSRINSFLSPSEIRELAELEASGKLTSTYNPPNLSSALTIASAERQLKLGSTRPKTAASCRSNHDKMADFLDLNSSVPPPTSYKSRSSFSFKPKVRPMTAICEVTADVSSPRDKLKDRAKTAPLNIRRKPFNSHETTDKGVRTLNNAVCPKPRPKTTSMASRSSVDSNLGADQYRERKVQMLRFEAQKGAELDGKKQCFLKKVGTYVESNPPRPMSNTPASTAITQAAGESLMSSENNGLPSRSKRNRSRMKGVYTSLTEEEYKRKVRESWKDISKCRYLRIPNDKNDLSNYNTLVTDHLKLLEVFKKRSQTSFLSKLKT